MRLIDENVLLEEIEKLPFINERYDHEHANKSFINGIETFHVMVLDVLKRQPTIEPKPQWIPVTERLPEIHNTVLVFARYNGQSANSMRIKRDTITTNFRDSHGEWIDMGKGYRVEAWMPLPEPYEEANDD